MMLYVLLAGMIASAASGWLGYQLGQDSEIAKQAAVQQASDETFERAMAAASEAISRIEVKNVTINRKLETKVRTERVFTDCRSGADSVQLYNSGIEGAVEPADRSKLPAKDAAR